MQWRSSPTAGPVQRRRSAPREALRPGPGCDGGGMGVGASPEGRTPKADPSRGHEGGVYRWPGISVKRSGAGGGRPFSGAPSRGSRGLGTPSTGFLDERAWTLDRIDMGCRIWKTSTLIRQRFRNWQCRPGDSTLIRRDIDTGSTGWADAGRPRVFHDISSPDDASATSNASYTVPWTVPPHDRSSSVADSALGGVPWSLKRHPMTIWQELGASGRSGTTRV